MRIRIFCLLFIFMMSGVYLTALANKPDETPQTLSIDVKDTDIRDVIRMISRGYNINILMDQDISGKATLHLVDVPIMEGLRSIAESNGLEVIKEGSVYKIQKAKDEQKSMIRYLNGKLTIDVQNVEVKDFLKELSSRTAVSIVPEAKIEGKITGKLYDTDLYDGLRTLLESNGFRVIRRNNIYQILSGTESQQSQPQRPMENISQQGRFYVDYNNGKVSLDVSNGDLENVIKAIAERSDIEIITYGSIRSEVNAKLENAPLTEALALLLGGTRFTFVQKNNVILIGDRNTATPSGQALSKSELIHLRHIKADNIPSILPKDIPASNVRVIKEQNALLISGTSEDIVAAQEFLKTIDIPTPQVRIDAVVVEFKNNVDKEFGIRGGSDSRLVDSSYNFTPFPQTNRYGGSQAFEMGMSGKFIKGVVKDVFNSTGFIGDLPDDFFLMLRALESQDKAKVLAQPSILTLNGNKASIDVSETQYFKIVTGVGENYTSRFQPIKFGIQLDIVPWISQSGQITAEITPNISNSEKTNNEGYPNVSTRSITTTVRLNDGETLVLGGLIKNQETEYSYKVPFLGNIPIIGALFRHSGKNRIKSNLVVFITPHIVTKEDNVDLDRELEKYELHNKDFIERQIHKRLQKVKNKNENDSVSDDSVSLTDTTVITSDTTISDTKNEGSIKQTETKGSDSKEPEKKEKLSRRELRKQRRNKENNEHKAETVIDKNDEQEQPSHNTKKPDNTNNVPDKETQNTTTPDSLKS